MKAQVYTSDNPPPRMTSKVWRMVSDKSLLVFGDWAAALSPRDQKVMGDYMRDWQ
jgi:hypothetical protein